MPNNPPIADPNDSLLGWASQTELRLASTLKDNDWFTEAGLDHDECEAIEKFYGTFLGRQLDFGADFSVLIASTLHLRSRLSSTEHPGWLRQKVCSLSTSVD